MTVQQVLALVTDGITRRAPGDRALARQRRRPRHRALRLRRRPQPAAVPHRGRRRRDPGRRRRRRSGTRRSRSARSSSPDPAAPDPSVHFGSYFVFRKLEQNVALFKQAERDLAAALGLPATTRARRRHDGRPLRGRHPGDRCSAAPARTRPVANNFDYDSDAAGLEVPVPRATSARPTRAGPAGAGRRPATWPSSAATSWPGAGRPTATAPTTPTARSSREDRPTGDVGLLFMAFNADLGQPVRVHPGRLGQQPRLPVHLADAARRARPGDRAGPATRRRCTAR